METTARQVFNLKFARQNTLRNEMDYRWAPHTHHIVHIIINWIEREFQIQNNIELTAIVHHMHFIRLFCIENNTICTRYSYRRFVECAVWWRHITKQSIHEFVYFFCLFLISLTLKAVNWFAIIMKCLLCSVPFKQPHFYCRIYWLVFAEMVFSFSLFFCFFFWLYCRSTQVNYIFYFRMNIVMTEFKCCCLYSYYFVYVLLLQSIIVYIFWILEFLFNNN